MPTSNSLNLPNLFEKAESVYRSDIIISDITPIKLFDLSFGNNSTKFFSEWTSACGHSSVEIIPKLWSKATVK